MTLESLGLPVTGERFRLEPAETGVTILRLADEVAVGTLELDAAPDSLTIRSLCIEEPYRSYGAGSEAILLFNRACDTARIPLVRAWAPPDRGLAVYFWIRMGFHPLHGAGPEGGLWFERRPDRPA